jgi:hypothetical protein
VESLTFGEPDLLPQPFSLEEDLGPPPDSHRRGLIAQPVDKDWYDAGSRGLRLIVSPTAIDLSLTDDIDDMLRLGHRRTALPR